MVSSELSVFKRVKAALIVSFVVGVATSVFPSAGAAEVDAKTWLSGEISLSIAPPDEAATVEEVGALQDRVASLSDDDKSNAIKWVKNTPNHHWIQTLLRTHIDIGPPSPKKGRTLALMNLAIL